MEEETYAKSVDSIFKIRERLIILGLTGRTGSGCSTVASILKKEKIDELDLKSYKTCDFNNADERKYSIIYRFMKEGDKWKQFYVIEASTIIFSFIAEGTFGKFYKFLDQICLHGHIEGINTIKKDFYESFTNLDNSKYRKNSSEQKKEKVFDELTDIRNILKNKSDEKDVEIIEKAIDQYCNILNDKKKKFKEILSDYQFIENDEEKDTDVRGEEQNKKVHDLYSHIMQVVGNNIRSSGSYDSEESLPGKEITVAERINDLIKLINFYEESKNGEERKVRICIDALRNTFEIQYFRDKYRAFYAVAVNTEDEYRRLRLEMNFNKRQLESLDDMEYPGNNTQFYKQNIEGCLEISDIYLYNPQVNDNKYFVLTEQLVKYIALMLHPGLVSPTHIERCMQLAFNAKYNSGCISRKVGAVVTGADFSVRSVGWNDVPKGQVPCNLRCVEDYCRNKDPETFSEFELTDDKFGEVMNNINDAIGYDNRKDKMKGKTFQYCFKDVYTGMLGNKNQVHTRALHAEENAFLQIAKYGGAEIQGGKLFTTASPCELCSKKAYQLGIKEIYYIDPYPGISKKHILSFGKKNNPKMILFMGAIGDAYISLYSSRISYKDELELQTGIKVKDIAARKGK